MLLYQSEKSLEILVEKDSKSRSIALPSIAHEEMIPLSERQGLKCFYATSKTKIKHSDYQWLDLLAIEEFDGSDGAIVCEALGKLWGLFDEGHLTIPSLFKKGHFKKEEITFYGGTFNPWHEGHSECLRKCPAKNIVIVPDSSPWKDRSLARCYYKSYLEICRKFEKTNYSIFPGFFGLEQPNPTSHWIRRLVSTDCSFLMGDDNYKALFKWIDIEELLLNLSNIYVLSRDHSLESLEAVTVQAKEHNPLLNVIFLGDHEFKSLSSTKLRRR